jgi:hypothetical protein
MKDASNYTKEEDDTNLQDQRYLHEDMPDVGIDLGHVRIREPGDAECIQNFHDAGYRAKSGKGTPGMERRVVRDVIEYPAKHVVVGQLQDGTDYKVSAISKEKRQLLTVHSI